MNILFIWYGLIEPLYEWRNLCINRALKIYPDAHFQCITTYVDFYGMEVIDARCVLSEMRDGGYYADEKSMVNNILSLSDEMRFWWLERHQNTLYLDTDTYCTKPMTATPRAGKAGIEALWSGSESKPFSDILSIRTKGDIFVRLAGKVDAIDLTEYFKHKPLWAKDIRNPRKRKNKIIPELA